MPALGPLCFTLTLAIASGLGASRSAIADTISTFQLATTVADGTVNGNLQIDTTTGKPEYGDFHVPAQPCTCISGPNPTSSAQWFHTATGSAPPLAWMWPKP